MDFDEYQEKALGTDQRRTGADAIIIPLLGLAGETGTLLSEYKKRLRDGESHTEYEPLVAEELGDLLWYIANLASKFDLSLSDIAAANLAKTSLRWSARSSGRLFFDEAFPEHEQLPRAFKMRFEQRSVDDRLQVVGTCVEGAYGEPLTDAAERPDGYRYHDILHLSFAVHLGWSPITRRNLRRKRRSDPEVDEAQDGGRAMVIEEAVAAYAHAYARRHALLEGVSTVDYDALRTIRDLTSPFEVAIRTSAEWERAILEGFRVFRLLIKHNGGWVEGDLARRVLTFQPLPGS
jgi:NTP pyrophosphatase (non-canonical NTP hydrolase)